MSVSRILIAQRFIIIIIIIIIILDANTSYNCWCTTSHEFSS